MPSDGGGQLANDDGCREWFEERAIRFGKITPTVDRNDVQEYVSECTEAG